MSDAPTILKLAGVFASGAGIVWGISKVGDLIDRWEDARKTSKQRQKEFDSYKERRKAQSISNAGVAGVGASSGDSGAPAPCPPSFGGGDGGGGC